MSLQKVRLDGGYEYKGDSVWMQSIVDLNESYYYAAFFHDWLTAECFEGKTNWTFTAPDFSDWTYIGNSLVAFRECDHWMAPSFENKKMIHVIQSPDIFTDKVNSTGLHQILKNLNKLNS